MNFIEVLSDGFADVRAHAGRTALQTLGVVLGVASVVATMGLTAGGKAQSMQYYTQSGGVLKVLVWSKPVTTVHASARELASRGLSLDDIETIRASIPGFDLVEPELDRRLQVSSPRLIRTYEVSGVGPLYAALNDLRLEGGRFITDEDVISSAAVCVLGADRAREFFGSEDPVGKQLHIGNHLYRVAGVQEYREFYWNRGDTYNALGWMNEMILVPVSALQAREVGAEARKLDEIGLQLVSVDEADKAVPALRRLLLARHGAEDFEVYARKERLEQMNRNGQVYDIAFRVCGVISLLVGGIVLANILMASFTERMREVGVRKALGAKGWQIAVQFLLEATIVTGFGGATGLALGGGFVHIMASMLNQPAVLTPAMVAAAVTSATTVGLAFGLYPAVKAARLDPVVALRYE